MDSHTRCPWVNNNPLMIKYHDEEWGVPVYDDKKLFEFLILEGAQAGLSWETILNKRESYRKALDNFEAKKIAKYTEKDIERLLKNPGIVRNRLKILATINNAKKFLEIQKEHGSFAKYIWKYTDNKVIERNNIKTNKEYPTTSKESDELSKDLKKRGMKFVGSTIIYAHMQATGMINDHSVNCFRKQEV